jgi:hypothetical protein
MERNVDVDGEDVEDGPEIAGDGLTMIGGKADGAVADEVAALDVFGTTGSSSRRIPSVLTR